MKEERKTTAEAPDLPFSLNTERAVLTTLATRRDMITLHEDTLDEGLFYYKREKAAFKTLMKLASETDAPIEMTALQDTAATMDNGYDLTESDLEEIFDAPNTVELTSAIERLAILKHKREAWTIMQKAAARSVDRLADIGETLSDTIQKLTDILNVVKGSGICSFQDAVNELMGIVKDNRAGKERSLHTGYDLFDQKHLLRPGTLTVIAAFTSVGKSALAMNIAVNVARNGNPTAYYSLEMGKAELAARAVSPEVRIAASIIANEALSDAGYETFKEMAPPMGRLPIFIDERSTVSFDSTISSIRKMARVKGVRLVVIDYLQIYTQTGENVEANLAQMARAAKNVAVETGTAVILLSQLNRSSDTPSLKMLRGSGQIEESADNVVLIDRPKAYPDGADTFKSGGFKGMSTQDRAVLSLAKGRGVGTMQSLLQFLPQYTLFVDTHEPTNEEKAQMEAERKRIATEEYEKQQEEGREELPF